MNHVIVAPHPDDELIGCFSLLASGIITHVFYCFDLDAHRIAEAESCARRFGFTPLFNPSAKDEKAYLSKAHLYVPAITDSHPEHKLANQRYRGIGDRRTFYSVDLDRAKGKSVVNGHPQKRQALNECYPSQRQLWDTDASYYLFENLQVLDVQVLARVPIQVLDEEPISLMVPPEHLHLVQNTLGPVSSFDTLIERLIQLGVFSFEIDLDGSGVIRL